MEKQAMEDVEQRVKQLEQLTWSIFRALETYITYNDLRQGGGEHERKPL